MGMREEVINQYFKQLADKLESESRLKVAIALRLYEQADDNLRALAIHQIGFTGDPNSKELAEYFDTLDLIDELDNFIDNMKANLKLN